MNAAPSRMTSLGWTLALTLFVLLSIRSSAALMDLFLSDTGDRARALGKIGSAVLAQFFTIGLLGVHSRRADIRLLENGFLCPPLFQGWAFAAAIWALWLVPNLASGALANSGELSGFNLVGSFLAGPGAGTAEELIFRGILFGLLARGGWNPVLQVLISAAAFGLSHAGWSLLSGDIRVGIFAMFGTAIAGLFFGVVCLASGRRMLPVVVLHAAVNVVIEPWLVLAVIEGNISLPN